MKKTVLSALLAAAYWVGAVGTAGAEAQMVTAENPQTIRALLARWGYQPGEITTSDNTPSVYITIEGLRTGIGFGGCTNGRGCTYIVLVNTYTDVQNPPLDWLNALNVEFDSVTVMRGSDNLLTLRSSVMLGAGGIAEALFREVLTEWVTANGDIADRAIAAHLVTPEPAAAPRT